MYEGDILITLNPGESPELLQKRNAQRYRQYLWKTKIVPYEVSETLGKISLRIHQYWLENLQGRAFSFARSLPKPLN